MNQGRISTRYAKALWLSLPSEEEGARVYEQVAQVLPALESVRSDFTMVLESAIVSLQEKERFTRTFFDRFAPALVDFATLMVRRGRGAYLERALEIFQSLYRQFNDILYVCVVSVNPLSQEQERRLKELISSHRKGTIELHSRIDSSLIGGFQLEIDDEMLDRSVRGELANMARALA